MTLERRFSLAVQYASTRTLPSRAQVRRWVNASLCTVDAPTGCHLLVRFVDRAEARALNRQFRTRDYPTNVLTFNYDARAADIVICAPVIEKEAREQRKLVTHHYAHMVVHGTLHALGFDHEETAEAAHMEEIEAEILARFGVRNPYA